MQKQLALITLALLVSLGITASALAKDVHVKGYTTKDGTVVKGYTKNVKDSGTTKVKGYTRKDGTKVKGYERKN